MSTELASTYVWHSPLESPYVLAGFPWLQTEGKYRRLPVNPAFPLPSAVDNLANNTAGGQIRFRTNSTKLAIQVRLAGPANMYHMPATGQCGFDCYEELEGLLQYRSTAAFDVKAAQYEAVLFEIGRASCRERVL